MKILYTLLFVGMLFSVLFQVGKRLYPGGSGRKFPAWISLMPNPLLKMAGVVVTCFGLVTMLVSGQLLFETNQIFTAQWLALIGILWGMVATLYGIGLFGVLLSKKQEKSCINQETKSHEQ